MTFSHGSKLPYPRNQVQHVRSDEQDDCPASGAHIMQQLKTEHGRFLNLEQASRSPLGDPPQGTYIAWQQGGQRGESLVRRGSTPAVTSGGKGLRRFDEVVTEIAGDRLVGHLALIDIEAFAEVRIIEQCLAGTLGGQRQRIG